MRSTLSRARLMFAVTLVLLSAAAFASAQGRDRGPAQEFQRFSLSMDGGFGFAEGHHGLLDLRAEFQVGLTRRLRLGLGLGYLNDNGRRGMDGGADQRGMSSWYGFTGAGMADDGLRARIMPVSLNLYYGLPVGRKWSGFMSGGGSWYHGSFDGPAGDQRKNAWGGQAGLGVEYRVAPRLQLIAEAEYRFVEFERVITQVNTPLLAAEQLADSLLRAEANPVADFLRGVLVPLAPKPIRTSDVNLSGLSLRMGVKFGI